MQAAAQYEAGWITTSVITNSTTSSPNWTKAGWRMAQHIFVKENDGVESLILSAGGNIVAQGPNWSGTSSSFSEHARFTSVCKAWRVFVDKFFCRHLGSLKMQRRQGGTVATV